MGYESGVPHASTDTPNSPSWGEVVQERLVHPFETAREDLRMALRLTDDWDHDRRQILGDLLSLVENIIYHPDENKFYQPLDPSGRKTGECEVLPAAIDRFVEDIRRIL